MNELKSDLHLHTQESKVGSEVFIWEGIKNAIKILVQNHITFFSFTDHDSFNLKFYMQAKKIIKNHNLNMFIIPGVEITCLNSLGKLAHVIFYFEENLNLEILTKIQNIIQKNVNKQGIKIQNLINKFELEKINFALICHVGKENFITKEDLKSILPYVYAVETNKNHPNLKKINQEFNIKNVLFSDTHIWTKYVDPNVYINKDEFLNFIKKENKSCQNI